MQEMEFTPLNLRIARRRAGHTQRSLAKASGLHWRTIQNLERDLESPLERTLKKIGKALDIDWVLNL